MTELEQALSDLAKLRKTFEDLRTTFAPRHMKPLTERLTYLEQRIEDATSRGIVPIWKIQEASALRHALAFMKAVSALTAQGQRPGAFGAGSGTSR